MPRRIIKKEEGKLLIRREEKPEEKPTDPIQEWGDKIKNIIPAGVTAGYLAVLNFIPEDQSVGYLSLLFLGLLGTAFLIARDSQFQEGDDKKYPIDWVHVTISCLAFLSWAYALGEPARTWGIFQAWIALLGLVVANFFLAYVYTGSSAPPLPKK